MHNNDDDDDDDGEAACGYCSLPRKFFNQIRSIQNSLLLHFILVFLMACEYLVMAMHLRYIGIE